MKRAGPSAVSAMPRQTKAAAAHRGVHIVDMLSTPEPSSRPALALILAVTAAIAIAAALAQIVGIVSEVAHADRAHVEPATPDKAQALAGGAKAREVGTDG